MGLAGSSWMAITFSGVVAALAYSAFRMVQERRFYKHLPKPPHHWFWGHLKLMGETMESLPHDVHYQCAATTIANKYNLPGVFYLDLWPAACGQVVVTDPDVALHMTVTKNHPKHEAEKWFVDPLIGAGNIVTTEGAEWKYLSVPSQSRPRWTTDLMSLDIRCSLPLLLYSILATCAPWQAYPVLTKGIDLCLQDKIAEELMEFRSILREKAESGEKFSLEEITLHTTFDVIGKATFGHSLNAKRQGSPALDHWEAMSRAFAKTRETWNFIAIFLSKRVVKAETKKLDVILCDMIQNRFNLLIRDKADLRNKKGLGIMDLILRDYIEEIRQTGKQRLDRKFLGTALCQVKTLLIAGTGTTSDVICYTIMMLSVHPEVVRKLREEHDRVFTKGIDASYDMLCSEPYRLNQLEYTTNVIKEVLRFYPIGNTARAEHPVDKYLDYQGQRYSTKGKMVLPVQLAMHLNPEIFQHPTKFDPDRYTREDFPRHAWRPFERGPRGCLGQPLAMDELKTALLLTIRDFDFTCEDIKPNKKPRVAWTDWDLTFGDRAFQEFVFEARPRDGMPMSVKMSGW